MVDYIVGTTVLIQNSSAWFGSASMKSYRLYLPGHPSPLSHTSDSYDTASIDEIRCQNSTGGHHSTKSLYYDTSE